MAADTHLHSLFGRAVQPHSFERLASNPGVLLRDERRERVRSVRLAAELISPFDAPDDDGAISAAQECWLHTAIAIALAAKQHEDLPASSWVYADGRIVPGEFDPSWLALRKRALLTVAVEIKYAAAEVGAWLAQFGNEDGMVAHLERVIWPDGVPRCHRCGNQRVVRTPREPRRLWCGACRLEFTAAQSTVIGSSHWPLPCWFASAYLHLADGLTTLNLARACNLNPQATWDILVGKRGAAGKLTAEQWDRLADVIVLGRTPPNPTGAVAEPVGTRPTFGRNSGRALGKQAERRKVIKLGRGEFERPKAAAPAFTLFEPRRRRRSRASASAGCTRPRN